MNDQFPHNIYTYLFIYFSQPSFCLPVSLLPSYCIFFPLYLPPSLLASNPPRSLKLLSLPIFLPSLSLSADLHTFPLSYYPIPPPLPALSLSPSLPAFIILFPKLSSYFAFFLFSYVYVHIWFHLTLEMIPDTRVVREVLRIVL
jgi:hypothetical protein